MKLRTLDDLPRNLQGKRVFLRLNWDLPGDVHGRVTAQSLFKMKASVPTIRELRARGAVVTMATYWRRPGGKVVPALSLKKLLAPAQKMLRSRIRLLPLPPSPLPAAFLNAEPGDLFLFENVRFHPGEEKNDPKLAAAFATTADYFVNDAFASAHRSEASIVGIARLLPSVAGRLMQHEVETLCQLLVKPKHPFVVVLGGAKISTKFAVMKAMLKVCDTMLVGGGIANTLLGKKNIGIGLSKAEPQLARGTIRGLEKIILPVDLVVSRDRSKPVGMRTVHLDRGQRIGDDEYIVDFGPGSMARYIAALRSAKTILWNGPFGINEVPAFNRGNRALARAIAARTRRALTIVGGGETIDIIDALHLVLKFSFCSTGGGAMLEFLEGKQLPGITPLIK